MDLLRANAPVRYLNLKFANFNLKFPLPIEMKTILDFLMMRLPEFRLNSIHLGASKLITPSCG